MFIASSLLLLPLFIHLQTVYSSNILFFHLVATSSHRISIWPLAEKLADKGHHVTYIFPMENPPEKHLLIEELVPSKMVPILKNYVGHFDINFRLNNSVDQWTSKLFSKCLELCEAFYDSPEIQSWLAKPGLHYDLIMIDALPGDCAYGLVHHFKAKHILFAPVIPHFIWDAVGIVPESASIPEGYFHRKPTEMGFINRLLGTYAFLSWRFAFENFLTQVESVIKKKFNLKENDYFPSLLEFERNTSLVLVNSHFIEDYPFSWPPIIQSYSGLWCSKEKLEKRKSIPEDISQFLKDSEGFVYVSFGSSVISSAMPAHERIKYFEAFRLFSKLKFLWKWNGPLPEDTPKNLLLRPWFPQLDILSHPKIKGFITQAGRPSTQEAICHGVPMITIPIFADQNYNANRLEYMGAAINLDIQNISMTTLQSALKTVVYTEVFKTRMKELSNLFRDRPLDPLENALYWTEYVLRNNDTTHLRPLGMSQNWYQRRLLDVYLFCAFLFLVIALIICYLFKVCVYQLRFNNKIKID